MNRPRGSRCPLAVPLGTVIQALSHGRGFLPQETPPSVSVPRGWPSPSLPWEPGGTGGMQEEVTLLPNLRLARAG